MAYVIDDSCIACGSCIDECPVEAISEGDIYSIDADMCTIVVLAQMFVLQNQFIQHRKLYPKDKKGAVLKE